MRAHFTRHGAVHAIWLIAVLTAIIAWLLLRTPDGKSIGDYIAFAASIASLILAVIAIGYSMLSNEGLIATVGNLNSSSSTIAEAAENIKAQNASLDATISELSGQVADVPASMRALTDRLDQKIASEAEKEAPTVGDENAVSKSGFDMEYARFGVQLTLYILAKAFSSQKPFDAAAVIKDTGGIWPGLIMGGCLIIEQFSPLDVKIEMFKIDDKSLRRVVSFGSIDVQSVLENFPSFSDDDRAGMQAAIDKYFAD